MSAGRTNTNRGRNRDDVLLILIGGTVSLAGIILILAENYPVFGASLVIIGQLISVMDMILDYLT